MVSSRVVLILVSLTAFIPSDAQNIPFLELLNPEGMMQLAQLGMKLSQSTAQNAARNEKDIISREESPLVQPLNFNNRPSQVLGQAYTNVARPLKEQIYTDIEQGEKIFEKPTEEVPPRRNIFEEMLSAFTGEKRMPVERRERAHAVPSLEVESIKPLQTSPVQEAVKPRENPLVQLASAFFKSPTQKVPTEKVEEVAIRPAQAIPDMKSVVPGAQNNFGLPKGRGCLPFLGEFMQLAYGNCVNEADEKAYETWGEEIRSAVLSGKMDLLRASRESCRRGAEREQCNQLTRAISNCDIMDSLQISASLQRNLKRCEEISGIVDQNPMTVLNQVNGLINGEFAHGFLNNFLG